jgi:NAD(P)-dependent dehydrogenase (short-subunit alcohol dehydrogenase family)
MTAEAGRRFDGRVVVVTGGASGIGEATVHQFGAQGASVILVDINGDGAERVARSAQADGSHVSTCIADIGTLDGWAAVTDFVTSQHDRLDVVVNNATGPEVGPLLEISEPGWQRTFDTNVGAVWRSAKALAPIMGATGGGAFVNLSSNAALRAVPGLGAYGAAKAAIISLTRSLSVELHDLNIRANSITPGVILSPMIKLAVDHAGRDGVERSLGTRCGAPDELARVILFLASDDAAYVNGENIQVDGGWFAGATLEGLRFGIPAPEAR